MEVVGGAVMSAVERERVCVCRRDGDDCRFCGERPFNLECNIMYVVHRH